MDISSFADIEKTTKETRGSIFRFGLAVFFVIAVLLFVSFISGGLNNSLILAVAAGIAGYMAMNIGANDVANNVGPAVGSKALNIYVAVIIAVVFEASGALIGGADVVTTIKGGIVDSSHFTNANEFIWLMLAAILAGAIWLNIATALGAPVSTTHSIIGGVLGSSIAASGWGIVNWMSVGKIFASWIISPILGAIFAASLLYTIKRTITYKQNMRLAAQKIVPLLIAFMVFVFSSYLIQKGLKNIFVVPLWLNLLLSLALGLGTYFVLRPLIKSRVETIKNTKDDISTLFTIPLIISAALLSFAHGANDVANAIGPLAAINDIVLGFDVHTKSPVPFWIMTIGALGIGLGLALYGPKLIKTVGTEITDLDKIRAFCIAISAAFTVILATNLGLPVSSTHIAVGGVFGVGFLREYIKSRYANMQQQIIDAHADDEKEKLEAFLQRFNKGSFEKKTVLMEYIKNKQSAKEEGLSFTKKERKQIKKVYQKELVKRSVLTKIIAAWFITLPASAILSAFLFFTIRGMML